VVICLERGADCWHLVQLMPLATPKSHHLLPPRNPGWFTFLVPACLGCPGKGAIKRVAAYIVCLYYCILNLDLSRLHRLVITLLLCTVVIENSIQMPIVLLYMVYIRLASQPWSVCSWSLLILQCRLRSLIICVTSVDSYSCYCQYCIY